MWFHNTVKVLQRQPSFLSIGNLRLLSTEDPSVKLKLRSKLASAIDDAKRKHLALQKQLRNNRGDDEIRMKAQLIVSNLHLIRKSNVTVFEADDLSGAGKVSVQLNRAEFPDPADEADFLFKQSRKMKRGNNKIETMILENEVKLQKLEEEWEMRQESEDFDYDPETWLNMKSEMEASAAVNVSQINKKKTEQATFRKIEVEDGIMIFIGRTSRENDILTFRVAKPGDHWLHARDCAGSHVIVKYGSCTDETIRQSALQTAANLAARYSKAKTGHKVEVTVADPKFLRKPKNAKPGQVRVLKECGSVIGLPDRAMDLLDDKQM